MAGTGTVLVSIETKGVDVVIAGLREPKAKKEMPTINVITTAAGTGTRTEVVAILRSPSHNPKLKDKRGGFASDEVFNSLARSRAW
jgi:hypothetical protein